MMHPEMHRINFVYNLNTICIQIENFFTIIGGLKFLNPLNLNEV